MASPPPIIAPAAAELPTFAEICRQASVHLADARDWLAADWRDGSGPTDAQADAKRAAMTLITRAKIKLEQARR